MKISLSTAGCHCLYRLLMLALTLAAGCSERSSTQNASLYVGSYLRGQGDVQVRVAGRGHSERKGYRHLEWWVDRKIINRQPNWDPFNSPVPLSANEACELALRQTKERFPQVKEWIVGECTLKNVGSQGAVIDKSLLNLWVYQIEFQPVDQKTLSEFWDQAMSPDLIQVVLLDRTVITPELLGTIPPGRAEPPKDVVNGPTNRSAER